MYRIKIINCVNCLDSSSVECATHMRGTRGPNPIVVLLFYEINLVQEGFSSTLTLNEQRKAIFTPPRIEKVNIYHLQSFVFLH
jgi:hypothetical protein